MKIIRIITYLIYIILWEALTVGGCAYLVFFKGHSSWWFVIALLLSGAAVQPGKWFNNIK